MWTRAVSCLYWGDKLLVYSVAEKEWQGLLLDRSMLERCDACEVLSLIHAFWPAGLVVGS